MEIITEMKKIELREKMFKMSNDELLKNVYNFRNMTNIEVVQNSILKETVDTLYQLLLDNCVVRVSLMDEGDMNSDELIYTDVNCFKE
ncbi:MAG: hypothetical protein HDT39_01365 [Lachnospiraceae bacterium]|nr:hypothetical protein [Lachnospiraceae bacterium]